MVQRWLLSTVSVGAGELRFIAEKLILQIKINLVKPILILPFYLSLALGVKVGCSIIHLEVTLYYNYPIHNILLQLPEACCMYVCYTTYSLMFYILTYFYNHTQDISLQEYDLEL